MNVTNRGDKDGLNFKPETEPTISPVLLAQKELEFGQLRPQPKAQSLTSDITTTKLVHQDCIAGNKIVPAARSYLQRCDGDVLGLEFTLQMSQEFQNLVATVLVKIFRRLKQERNSIDLALF